MMIIETCPKCGHDLQDLIICTYPPIPRKECTHCGWSWEGKRDQVVRVPFKEPVIDGSDKSPNPATAPINELQTQNTQIPYILLNGNLDNKITTPSWPYTNGTVKLFDLQDNNPCKNCPNHPDNGGSGLCNCIVGLPKVIC